MLPFTTYHIPESGSEQNGQSHHSAWFIVHSKLSGPQEELLSKIAQAAGYVFETDVRVLVVPETGMSLPSFSGKSAPDIMISFGYTAQDFGWNLERIKSPSIQLDRTRFIASVAVDTLEKSADHKKALWRELQAFLDSK